MNSDDHDRDPEPDDDALMARVRALVHREIERALVAERAALAAVLKERAENGRLDSKMAGLLRHLAREVEGRSRA